VNLRLEVGAAGCEVDPCWAPDFGALERRLRRRLAEEGHPRASLAASVIVDRGRSGLSRAAYVPRMGISEEELARLEAGRRPRPSGPGAVLRTPGAWGVHTMNDTLLAEVEARIDGARLSEAVTDLVLTACLAPEELADGGVDRAPRTAVPPGDLDRAPLPPSTYLANVRIEGFRGIGPPVTLPLTPGPGLTLVIGRNGTGKSSVSDALEVLLTGTTARRAAAGTRKTSAWLDGWRNLHHPDPTVVEADLVVEGEPGFTTVRRRWGAGAGFDDAIATVSKPGRPNVDFDSLAWDGALSAYRPFLPYSELGGLLDEGPSKLFDTLNAILGLGDLASAAGALAERRLALANRAKGTDAALTRLRLRMSESADPRAAAFVEAVSKRSPDLEAVASLVSGDGSGWVGDDDLGVLRALATFEPPDIEELDGAAGRLEAAASAVAAVAGTDAGDALRGADLLRSALELHAHRGDGDCPVCFTPGALSDAWNMAATAEERRLRDRAASAEASGRELAAAEAFARSLVRAVPAALSNAVGVVPGAEEAARSWSAWASGPGPSGLAGAGPELLAGHLRAAAMFSGSVESVASAAGEAVEAREDAWRPLAVDASAWLADALADRQDSPTVKDLKAAEDWLRGIEEDVRTERFEPLAKAAARVWEALRMRSSVDVGGVRLAGKGNRRHVEMQVQVDGMDGTALGVMSQGELHSLALSLFLPRATLDESPFRFVVIDDPVQAMDPAKVEGLARVLDETARTHQVIVLTHDDRLPDAVRRLGMAATVWEVSRRASSVLSLERVSDPVQRRIGDARTVARSTDLPAAVRARVVPTLCRQALEAGCVGVVRRRRLGRGDAHDAVERDLAEAKKLYPLGALALFDDESRTGEVLARLNGWRAGFGAAWTRCNKGAHEGDGGDLVGLVDDVSAISRRLEALA
jgi:recombinational DNA repair ATPase RecF